MATIPAARADHLHNATYMHEIYTRADPHVSGRATVPVLWDKHTDTLVNNESADILRMLNSGFGDLASGPDLYPEALRSEIDALNDAIYPALNNGVYRAGFATTQTAYEAAFADVFATPRQPRIPPVRRPPLPARRRIHRNRHPRLRHPDPL